MSDDDYERCLRVLHAVHPAHHWPHYATQAGIIRTAWCVEVRFRGDMATFDGDEMTRLVVAAHRERVRASLSARCRGVLTLMLHPRDADGAFMQRHPGLERLVQQ